MYLIAINKNKLLTTPDSALIIGKITSIDNNGSLVAPTIKYGCNTQQSNTGTYSLKTAVSDIKLQLIATALGYLTVETELFITQTGDSIVVDFFSFTR